MKLSVAILLVATSAYGSTLVVNNNKANTSSPCSTAGYKTIGAAITAAHSGDSIVVCPGIYPEAVYINKPSLKLTGLSADGSSRIELLPSAGIQTTDPNANADNSRENVILLVDSVAGVEISNISVNGSKATNTCATGNVGIYFRNASGSVSDSTVAYIGLNHDGSLSACQEGVGVYADNGSGKLANLTVTGSSVHNYNKNGITANGSGTTLVAENNTITGAGRTAVLAQNGIQAGVGAKGTFIGNMISANNCTPSSGAATSILFYQADDGQANDNVISESNNAIDFYFSNHGTANGNTVSKAINYDALDEVWSDYTVFEHNVITIVLEASSSGIYLCGGSHEKVENDAINDAPIGVINDQSSVDGCNGETANSILSNTYFNVGNDVLTLTDNSPKLRNSFIQPQQHERAKPSPLL